MNNNNNNNNLKNLYEKNYCVSSKDKLNLILEKFQTKSITDFHFEPEKDKISVKFRYSNSLINFEIWSHYEYEIFLNKILIKCGLDIIKDFKNNDGSFSYKNFHFRVSFVKSFYGISCVIRKLENIENVNVNFEENLYNKIFSLIKNKTKMILFSGPTTSGKTTSLAHIINKIKNNYKVHSIENPIEYKINGVIQFQCEDDEKSNILKYILRQDPEVIVVGEIRENNFAKLLFESSNTGHTILGTIHAKNVFKCIERIKDLGINETTIIKNVDLILNQRLIPLKCNFCLGKGCEKCFYSGKNNFTNIFEYFELTDEAKNLIINSVYIKEIDFKKFNFYHFPNEKLKQMLDEKIITHEEYQGIKNSF